jgi:hypothetical protein
VVKDTGANPVAGICVQVSGKDTGNGTTTGADGTYSIDALPTGAYTVQFTAGCGSTGSYAGQYYNGQTNVASATPVNLTAGQPTSGIDATMQPGATIAGVVTNAAGQKLSKVCVSVVPAYNVFDSFGGAVGYTTDGAYSVRNLTPGQYTVGFNCGSSHGLARQWFKAKAVPGSADAVSAQAGVVTSGISATLRRSGTITGRVTSKAGSPLSGICVTATRQGIPFGLLADTIAEPSAQTGHSGTYRMSGLPAGAWDVNFASCGPAPYGSQWYRGKAGFSAATPVTVTGGATKPGINAVLAPGGSISGRTTGSAGQSLGGVCVEAQDATTGSGSLGISKATGRYTITNLSTGSYQITFLPCFGQKPTPASFTRAALVRVVAPKAVTGINGRLGRSGGISGTVLGGPGATPQAGVCVVAVPVNPNGSFTEGISRAGGKYRIDGLGAGEYQLYFDDPFCFDPDTVAGGAPQWYNDQPTQATASDVKVTAGAVTSGVGATLGKDGVISGTVTNQSSASVAGECVTAYPVSPVPDPLYDETIQPATGVTASDGSYAIIGLLPGQYQVQFTTGCGDSGYQSQWWNGASSASTATTITVGTGATITGKNATLHS